MCAIGQIFSACTGSVQALLTYMFRVNTYCSMYDASRYVFWMEMAINGFLGDSYKEQVCVVDVSERVEDRHIYQHFSRPQGDNVQVRMEKFFS